MAETRDTVVRDSPAGGRGPRLTRKADELFRGLWASLFYSQRTMGKAVLLCSSDRREGASTVACSLAAVGSEPAGVARIALVDCNFRTPRLHEMLGVREAPGVADAVLNGTAPEEAIQRLSASLDVYAAGKVAGRTLDVLRSDNLRPFLENLCSAYDHVLIDTPAVNQFPDAQVLAGIVTDVVLVAHTERTPREAVAQARKRIEAAGAKVLGLVLNHRRYPIPRFLYRRV
ncbi:MAG: CpsD/CapB family tyrosine-protein kinase [Phycisphaerae bacterium]|nr:CpsD/CapB family tyrosine-protein kinase [Phycisphaerae bacterium]